MLEVLNELKVVNFSQHAETNIPLNAQQLKTLKQYDIKLGPKYTILSFWEHWCPPCRNELPTFLQLQNQFPESEIKIILINSDTKEYSPQGQRLIRDMKLEDLNHIFTASADIKKIFHVEVLPTTYILSKDHIIYEMPGSYNWSDKQSIENFKALSLKSCLMEH